MQSPHNGTCTFGCDAENRLLTASKTGLAATYQYDPLGRRTRKFGTDISTIYLPDDGSDEIAEYDGTAAGEPILPDQPSTNLLPWRSRQRQRPSSTPTARAASSPCPMPPTLAAKAPTNTIPTATASPTRPLRRRPPYRFTGQRLDPEPACGDRARMYDRIWREL